MSYDTSLTINIVNMALLPSKKIKNNSEISLGVDQVTFHENSISGDVVNGGTITNFSSTGMMDQADSVQLTVKNDQIEMKNNLVVKGTVTVENLEYVQAQVPKLNVKQAIMIDNNEVVWKDRLGKSVKTSSLTEVGTLKKLDVDKTFYAAEGRVGVNTQAPSAEFSVNVDGYEVITRMHEKNAYVGTHVPVSFAIGTDDTPRITCKPNGDVSVGQEGTDTIKMSVHGKLGIGLKNPQESLHVNGNIRFADKVFSSGSSTPKEGRWDTGSIVWNDQPEINQPVGWVCIKGGQPGAWRSFGTIN